MTSSCTITPQIVLFGHGIHPPTEWECGFSISQGTAPRSHYQWTEVDVTDKNNLHFWRYRGSSYVSNHYSKSLQLFYWGRKTKVIIRQNYYPLINLVSLSPQKSPSPLTRHLNIMSINCKSFKWCRIHEISKGMSGNF